MYGLYKYSSRNMLNNQSKEWTIKILFELNDEIRLIIRTISKAKTKESCTSKLFKIQNSRDIENLFWSETIKYNSDIQAIFNQNQIYPEEISFKNETDLQQTVIDFLPPREVFLNTVFLMQDSDNIFELLPSERLNVLKNVFGLLGIDEAKETISEKKKEISYKLKAYTDTSKYDEKIKQLILWYTSNYKQLIQHIHTIWTPTSLPSEIEELIAIQDKLTINELNSDIFSLDSIWYINEIIIDKKNLYQKLQQQIQNNQDEIKKKKNLMDSKRQERIIIENNNLELVKNINNIHPEILTELKNKKITLSKKQEEIENSLDKESISNFINNSANQSFLEDFSEKNNSINITASYLLIQHLTNKGKSLQEKISNIQLKIKNEELTQKHEQEKLTTEIATLQEKEKSLQTQYNQVLSTIEDFDKNTESQAIFHCEKIAENCPFIKVINKKTFDQLDIQKQQFVTQKTTIESQIQSIKIVIEQKQKEVGIQKTNNEIQALNNEITNYEQHIQNIKNFLNQINRKSIQENHNLYRSTLEEITSTDKKITEQEYLQSQIESYKQQKEKNDGICLAIDEQINTIIKETQELETNLNNIIQESQTISYDAILSAEKTNTQLHNYQRDIVSLIEDYKKIQLEIGQLKEEEKRLTNLYLIFSKEILLLVLQDQLPILNDIINDQLNKVVDYQTNLTLNKSSTDKLELEANIIDEKWSREIKSLSWGQKIILKLVWMIAISSYMNSPILFLDETINNLDIDTVSKVADMLEDFVKQKNMKLYTVTHNQQIQDMNIWDQTIEIKPNNKLG